MVDSRVSYLENELSSCLEDLAECKFEIKQLQTFILKQFGSVYCKFLKKNESFKTNGNASNNGTSDETFADISTPSTSKVKKKIAKFWKSQLKREPQDVIQNHTDSDSDQEIQSPPENKRKRTDSTNGKDVSNNKRSATLKKASESQEEETQLDSADKDPDSDSSEADNSQREGSDWIFEATYKKGTPTVEILKANQDSEYFEKMPNNRIRCANCNVVIVGTFDRFSRHFYSTHVEVKPFRCPFCKVRFGRKDKLKVHVVKSHPKERKQYRV